MASFIRRIAHVSVLTLLVAAGNASAQSVPEGWRAVADDGRTEAVEFVTMAPGWHLNPGPAALVYEAERVTGDTFRIEYDAFFFASEPSSFGAFFGGRGLEPASYDFFEVMIDMEGRFRLGHRAGPEYHEVIPWTRHEAIAIPTADEAVLNQVVIDVSPARLAVTVNGAEVTAFEPPAYARFEGAAGIRVTEGASVHVARFEFPATGTSAAL